MKVLPKAALRATKLSRDEFMDRPRRPIRVILDGVFGGYNIGAMFRLCDAMLLERLVICGQNPIMRKRRLVQAALGAQNWVPWGYAVSVQEAVREARDAGYQIAILELATNSITPCAYVPRFPVCLVIGGERLGVSQSIATEADVALTIPMLGMSNSLNLATASAIALYEICKHCSIPTTML